MGVSGAKAAGSGLPDAEAEVRDGDRKVRTNCENIWSQKGADWRLGGSGQKDTWEPILRTSTTPEAFLTIWFLILKVVPGGEDLRERWEKKKLAINKHSSFFCPLCSRTRGLSVLCTSHARSSRRAFALAVTSAWNAPSPPPPRPLHSCVLQSFGTQ